MAFGSLIGVIIRTIPPLPQWSIAACFHGPVGLDNFAHPAG
jgi:hypothetical protein